MWAFEEDEDRVESNVYAQHLAELNKELDVRATQDVRNVHGVLVVARGARIDYRTARQIVRHKLLMPLDKTVELENLLSARGLYRRFDNLLDKYSDLRKTHLNLEFDKEYEAICTRFDIPKLLAQKLTVMDLRQPSVLAQSLLGAWFACLIGRELGYDQNELALVHLAAVSRDIGLLHVHPDLLEKPSDYRYSDAEWRSIQSHVVASHMILKECEGLPERLMDAVMHHHENVDGTGYPTSCKMPELGQWAQMLGVGDTVAQLRLRRFAGSGRNLKDTMPVLLVGSDSCRREVLSAAVSVLNRSGVKRSIFHGYNSLPELKATLFRRGRALAGCSSVMHDMPDLIQDHGGAPKTLMAFIERLNLIMLRSGLADPELMRWLHMVYEDRDFADLADLVEVDLQQREMLWQLRRFHMNLLRYSERIEVEPGSPIQHLLERMELVFESLKDDRDLVEVEKKAS